MVYVMVVCGGVTKILSNLNCIGLALLNGKVVV